MRTLYLDCGMGAAGDMLTAALLELLPQPDEFVKRLNGLGIPGVTYRLEQAEKCGITGSRVTVAVNGETEHDHDHHHDHDHEHEHHHHHHHHQRKLLKTNQRILHRNLLLQRKNVGTLLL